MRTGGDANQSWEGEQIRAKGQSHGGNPIPKKKSSTPAIQGQFAGEGWPPRAGSREMDGIGAVAGTPPPQATHDVQDTVRRRIVRAGKWTEATLFCAPGLTDESPHGAYLPPQRPQSRGSGYWPLLSCPSCPWAGGHRRKGRANLFVRLPLVEQGLENIQRPKLADILLEDSPGGRGKGYCSETAPGDGTHVAPPPSTNGRPRRGASLRASPHRTFYWAGSKTSEIGP